MQEDIKLCDAVGVARHAISFIENSAARGVTMMAIGSKPHAIGIALAALSDPRVEVVCRTPASYRAVDVHHSAEPMFYQIEDRLDPASYIIKAGLVKRTGQSAEGPLSGTWRKLRSRILVGSPEGSRPQHTRLRP